MAKLKAYLPDFIWLLLLAGNLWGDRSLSPTLEKESDRIPWENTRNAIALLSASNFVANVRSSAIVMVKQFFVSYGRIKVYCDRVFFSVVRGAIASILLNPPSVPLNKQIKSDRLDRG
ncbi:hypothetical protein [Spirulina sp. 06S082]|uniref:hypothetical protein n=1 Tax=Spirulina sp. 06S082 TaxID=3110248 RepID=UPI002B21559C|nr:hypothetical protein [Spirulina sp. 06S082]MEA5469592.1 hypothetical protein [Spirulina sp. 06S082]